MQRAKPEIAPRGWISGPCRNHLHRRRAAVPASYRGHHASSAPTASARKRSSCILLILCANNDTATVLHPPAREPSYCSSLILRKWHVETPAMAPRQSPRVFGGLGICALCHTHGSYYPSVPKTRSSLFGTRLLQHYITHINTSTHSPSKLVDQKARVIHRFSLSHLTFGALVRGWSPLH